jgi:hypothetical protein
MGMRKVSVALVTIFLIASAPALVWGFFGSGFSGLWPGAWFQETGNWGPTYGLFSGSRYIGWEESGPNGFVLSASGKDVGELGDLIHRMPLRGLWWGASQEISLSRNCGLELSGWYLSPKSVTETEFENHYTVDKTWDAKPQWGFLEALAIFGHEGMSLIAGFRYDHFSARFTNGPDIGNIADVTANSYIPIVGAQCRYGGATSRLTFRAIGFPVIPGNFSYLEPFGSANSYIATGHYDNGYFLEIFAEYAWKYGPVDIGIFGRYNGTRIKSNATMTGNFGGVITTETWSVGIYRNSITVGGQVGLTF